MTITPGRERKGENMMSDNRNERRSTSARRAMYYTNYEELKRAYEAIGEAWL